MFTRRAALLEEHPTPKPPAPPAESAAAASWEERPKSLRHAASNGENALIGTQPRARSAHWHHKNSVGLHVHLTAVGADIRYNTRAHRRELWWDDHPMRPTDIPHGWAEFTDPRSDALFDVMSQECEFYRLDTKSDGSRQRRYQPAVWLGNVRDQAVGAYAQHVDPFLDDYIAHLPTWDGTPRLDGLLARAFALAPDTPTELAEWVVRSVMLVVLYRAHAPDGYEHHETPVLVGVQDIGKSSFWAALCPRREWFAGDVPVAARHEPDKKYCEACMGKIIACAGELGAWGRAEVEDIKRRLTLPAHNYRLPYDKAPSMVVMKHALVGDSNSTECLPNDPTGNRRWVPIEVAAPEDAPNDKTSYERITALVEECRDQLWAEALAAYIAGERPHVPPATKLTARLHVAKFRGTDELAEDFVARKVADCERAGVRVTLSGIMSGDDLPRELTSGRIRKALKSAGYRPRRTNAERWWEPVPDSELVTQVTPSDSKSLLLDIATPSAESSHMALMEKSVTSVTSVTDDGEPF